MANYNDVAKLANVSPTTISHVVNETRFVSEEVREKVLNAMKKLNYQPNLIARGLATGKTNTIGLIISDINNPFFPEIIEGLEDLALKNGYNIFLCNTDYNIDKAIKSIRALLRKKVDGIISDSYPAYNKFLMEELLNTNIPVTFIDWDDTNINADTLHFNFKPGTQKAVDYLVKLGHKKIYFVSGSKNLRTSKVREENFIDSLKKYKDSGVVYRVFEGNFKLNGGINAAKEIIASGELPNAIICANDITAIGVMKTFKEENIDIPEKVSIIGLDNIIFSELISPSLTTLEYSKHLIGETAMRLLLNRIKDIKAPKQKIYFTAKLIIRESTSVARSEDQVL